jgi:hypothetical protein
MRMTDETIDDLFNTMPGGVQGFCREWGYRQFARQVIEFSIEESENRVRDEMLSTLRDFIADRPDATALAALVVLSPCAQITKEDLEWAAETVKKMRNKGGMK